jgi:hypothetical protein
MSPPLDLLKNLGHRIIAQFPELGPAPAAAPAKVQLSKFTGAYYHKVSSGASADNRGIGGNGTLPFVRTDLNPNRNFVARAASTITPAVPSIAPASIWAAMQTGMSSMRA